MDNGSIRITIAESIKDPANYFEYVFNEYNTVVLDIQTYKHTDTLDIVETAIKIAKEKGVKLEFLFASSSLLDIINNDEANKMLTYLLKQIK